MKGLLRRVARVAWAEGSVVPGRDAVTVIVRSAPWVPRWLVVWVAASWFTAPHRMTGLVRRREVGGRRAEWETTWEPSP